MGLKMRVFVYWNLHRDCWSVKALSGPDKGRVVARTDHVLLSDVTGKVSQAGRARVLREGRKNVHAGIVGTLEGFTWDCSPLNPNRRKEIDMIESIGDRITYNPRKYTDFVHTVDESRFEGSAWAALTFYRNVYVA